VANVVAAAASAPAGTQDSNVLARAIGEPKLSLAQKLAAFDPDRHAGEVMATTQVGREVF
jgi:antitoxin MazE